MSGINFNAINAALRPMLSDLASEWLSRLGCDPRRAGNEIEAIDPRYNEGHSLKINRASGKWSNFNHPEDRGLDAISFYAHVHNLSIGEAAKRLAAPIASIGTARKEAPEQASRSSPRPRSSIHEGRR
jgi:hypothetical protein